jgi:hypothetical protein
VDKCPRWGAKLPRDRMSYVLKVLARLREHPSHFASECVFPKADLHSRARGS